MSSSCALLTCACRSRHCLQAGGHFGRPERRLAVTVAGQAGLHRDGHPRIVLGTPLKRGFIAADRLVSLDTIFSSRFSPWILGADWTFRGHGCVWQVAMDGHSTRASIPVHGWIDPRWWRIVSVLFARLRAHRVRACEQGACRRIPAIWALAGAAATQRRQL